MPLGGGDSPCDSMLRVFGVVANQDINTPYQLESERIYKRKIDGTKAMVNSNCIHPLVLTIITSLLSSLYLSIPSFGASSLIWDGPNSINILILTRGFIMGSLTPILREAINYLAYAMPRLKVHGSLRRGSNLGQRMVHQQGSSMLSSISQERDSTSSPSHFGWEHHALNWQEVIKLWGFQVEWVDSNYADNGEGSRHGSFLRATSLVGDAF
jgi:hypothetical protein